MKTFLKAFAVFIIINLVFILGFMYINRASGNGFSVTFGFEFSMLTLFGLLISIFVPAMFFYIVPSM